MTTDPVFAVFAYGTLKRGQCREHCWPAAPLSVEKAWTLGELYDTGPYPALFPGCEPVAGEVWTFGSDVFPEVLRTLDEVEEYRSGHEATNLYNRKIVECVDQQGVNHHAYVYFYGQQQDKGAFRRVPMSYVWAGRPFAVWPVDGDW